jgi:hypothetical protein
VPPSGIQAREMLSLLLALWFVAAPTYNAPQTSATGARTDVLQTSMGELQITPVHPNSLVLEWAALKIYVDPPPASAGAVRPKADLVLLTGSGQVPPDLKKASTQVVTEGMVRDGKTHTVTLPGSGLAQDVTVTGAGGGMVLDLGKRAIYISGDTRCSPAEQALKNIQVAFIAIDPKLGTTPEMAAACVLKFAPKIVYPYYAPDALAQQFAKDIGKKSDVRLRDW